MLHFACCESYFVLTSYSKATLFSEYNSGWATSIATIQNK